MFTHLFERAYRVGHGTAAPTSGQWNAGDFVINSAPSTSNTPYGWLCVTGGTSGTWVAVQPIKDLTSVTALTAAGAATAASNIITADTTSAGFNVTLAAPTAATPGNLISVVNTAANTVTLVAGTGTSIVGLATIAGNTSGTVKSASTFWYRV